MLYFYLPNPYHFCASSTAKPDLDPSLVISKNRSIQRTNPSDQYSGGLVIVGSMHIIILTISMLLLRVNTAYTIISIKMLYITWPHCLPVDELYLRR